MYAYKTSSAFGRHRFRAWGNKDLSFGKDCAGTKENQDLEIVLVFIMRDSSQAPSICQVPLTFSCTAPDPLSERTRPSLLLSSTHILPPD